MDTLVFVHGYLGGSAQWARQREHFSPQLNIITPDIPGFGLNHSMPAQTSIGEYADYVLDEATRQGVERFDLVGHSMGGMIVQEMIARAPQRIGRLVLYGTGPSGVLPERFEPLSESRRRLEADGPEATGRRISATWFLDYESAPGYHICAGLSALASLQAAHAGLTAMENWSGEAVLASIASPTLVLWGDTDRTYSWNQQEKLWRGIANAQLAVMPGCSHAAHLEKPVLFNSILKDFLGTN